MSCPEPISTQAVEAVRALILAVSASARTVSEAGDAALKEEELLLAARLDELRRANAAELSSFLLAQREAVETPGARELERRLRDVSTARDGAPRSVPALRARLAANTRRLVQQYELTRRALPRDNAPSALRSSLSRQLRGERENLVLLEDEVPRVDRVRLGAKLAWHAGSHGRGAARIRSGERRSSPRGGARIAEEVRPAASCS